MSKKDLLSSESYKGVRDFYPPEQALQNYITTTMRGVCERFGYVEYHASVLEPAELYASKTSDEIVKEQTYTFRDRGNREVTLRPEMTPTVARMVAGKRRELGYPLRWYSIPNLFRYERPQRGRLREHWQLNVDLFGSHAPAADAEIIAVAHALMQGFGAKESDFVIKVGSRNFLNSVSKGLGLSDTQAKKMHNLLDRRAKMPQIEFERDIADLGVALELLSPTTPPQDVGGVLALLSELGIENAVFDPTIVRGFDYYTGIVFEVFDTHPDNNRALFGGGRYDNLTSLFDEEQVPGVGFGMGDVTIRDFLAVRDLLPPYIPPTKVYLAVASSAQNTDAAKLANELRTEGVCVAVDFGDRKLADQIKTAVKHRIPYLIVVGENELSSGTFTAKHLETGSEEVLTRSGLSAFFLNAK
jgi:histidyl-tRNA synthetase